MSLLYLKVHGSLQEEETVSVDVGAAVSTVVVVVVGKFTMVVQPGSVAGSPTVSVTHFVVHGSSWLADELEVSAQPVLVVVRVCSVVDGPTYTVVHVVVVQRLSWFAAGSDQSAKSVCSSVKSIIF